MLVIVILLSSVRLVQGCRNEGLRVGCTAEEEEQVQLQQPCAKEGLHNRFVTLHLAPLCLSAWLGSSQRTSTDLLSDEQKVC